LNILALDTSTINAAVALFCDDKGVLVAPQQPEARHGRGLVPSIAELFQKAGISVRNLDCVAVGLGPGSYTGLRVGVSAAKTLAFATRCRLIGLDSLQVISRNAPVHGLEIAVIGDAQRGDLYTADFEREAPGAPLVQKRSVELESIDAWLNRMSGRTDVLVIGPGRNRLAKVGVSLPPGLSFGEPWMDYPTGLGVIDLAREVSMTNRNDDPWFLEPVYLRRSAAEDQWDDRALSRTPEPLND
jgi:tRNA threonylcarbamoyladenosine biosynthesis protein TsaB